MSTTTEWNRQRTSWRQWLFAAGLVASLAFAGCESSDDNPNGTAQGGTRGGATHSGGRAGMGGSGAADSGGASTEGGAPTNGGASAGASQGSGGHAGEHSSGGGGATGGIDAACDCQFEDGSSSPACTISIAEFEKRVSLPDSCEMDLDFLERATCDDGSTRYTWLEGSENDFTLVFSEKGELLYGSASGYVGGLCGDSTDVWSIESGAPPVQASCERCRICTGPSSAGGAPPDCEN
ncbi:MAG TPA: hypothetical protein VFQ61_35255 [Polyangiaceae bacterium]|nr:hypothetical protein [Polyangiaceae bacterium]